MFPVSIDSPFLIAPSVFSNVYWSSTKHHADNWRLNHTNPS